MLKMTAKIVLAGAIAFGLPAAALAHVRLESATPAKDAAVTSAPSALNLLFSEALSPKFTGVELTSADGKSVSLGQSSLANGKRTLVVPVNGKLTSGTYTVTWHALSADGHKTKGSYTFTVAP